MTDSQIKGNYEYACSSVVYLYDKIKDKYNIKLEAFMTYENQFNISNQTRYDIRFLDLKENNSLTISNKLYDDKLQWSLHLWRYPNGHHIFKNIDIDLRYFEIKDYVREIDSFFFGKEQEEQMSIFDLLGEL